MDRNPYPGKFVVFEGLDGAGKSTQSLLFRNALKQEHLEAYYTQEPTSGLIGGLIRGQLTKDWKSGAECLQLLFAADRLHHLETEIIPLLKRGVTVISDRYMFSSLAYGPTAGVKSKEWLSAINKYAILPDAVFLLNVSPKVCIQRIRKERYGISLFEKEAMLQRVQRNYAQLAKEYKSIIYGIDGEQTIEEVAEDVRVITAKIWNTN